MRRIIIVIFLVFILVASIVFALCDKKAVHRRGTRSSDLQTVVTKDENIERKDYYRNGVLTNAANKNYATVIKTRTGNTVLEQYLDTNGAPVIQSAGHYALLREYDENNRNYMTTYLDENNNPTTIKSGYAIVRRTYYETGVNEGKVENVFYFDISEHPATSKYGQYGVHYDYDELGRKTGTTYLDASGFPMTVTRGYATVKRTFYSDNTVETEMYYDETGSPVALSAGQYGIKHVDGQRVYLDRDGREIFNLNNWLHRNSMAVIIIGMAVLLLSLFLGKKGNVILLVLYIGFILYMTLLYRPEGESRAKLQLFWSYRQFLTSPSLRLEILNNIWLFIPLGGVLYAISRHCWIVLPGVVLSVIIEVSQYCTGFGLAELDDVISNGLGILIGFGFGYALMPIIRMKSVMRCQ